MSGGIVEAEWVDDRVRVVRGPDQVEFYSRAIDNYPDRSGDPSPGEWPDRPQNGFAADNAGPVLTKTEGKRNSVTVPYDAKRLSEIVQNGEDNPRKLSLVDAKIASKNRQQARGDYREFDKQTRAEGQTGVFGTVRAISFEAYYEGFES